GKDIPIEVINADIQMEPEKRRDLTVVPKVKLIEGTTYKIIAQKGIKSKGGQFTENDKIISFTTLGEKPIKKEIKPVEIKKEEKDKINEGKTYKIIDKKNIKSKGRKFTENDKIISFTTLGEKTIKKEIKPVEIKKEENKTGVKKESVKEEIIEKTNKDN